MRTASLLLSLALAWSCTGSDETRIVVELRTDYVPGEDFVRVETLVAPSPIDEAPEARRVDEPDVVGRDFLAGARVAALDVDAGTTYVRVLLYGPVGDVVARRDVVVDVDGVTGVTVLISRSCAGVTCPGATDPSTFTACVGGRCADPRCTPETPAYCEAPECEGATDCPTAGTCAAGSCLDGVCFAIPDDGLCAAGETCAADGRCVTGTMTDGGMMDGGVPLLDGGPDGGPADAGLMLADNYCPGDALLRNEMAIFLVRYIHGPDFVPPPATGTFSDVPLGAAYAPYVEQLARDGITMGCAVGLFCPDETVPRGQGAVFLVRTYRSPTYTPPSATGRFDDVPTSHVYADYIEQLARDGIAQGCTVDNYCPEDDVTRGELAVFLTRMRYGASYTPPAPVGLFDDVPPSHPYAAYIEQIARDRITNGCVR